MGIGTQLKLLDAESVGLHELTDTELKNLQEDLVYMMCDIAYECERHDIAWSLSGGNVLGCVRNQGFLPWDDDIDIFMTRGNYKKLKQIFDEKLSEKYEIEEPGDQNYIMQYPKIYKKGTTAKPILSTDQAKNCLFIDIFLMENTFDNKLRRNLHGLQCTLYLFIDSMLRTERCKDNLLKYTANDKKLNHGIKRRIFFSRFFKFRSLEKWLKSSNKCFSKVKNDSSQYVVVPGGNKRYFGELYDRKKMCTLKKMRFAGEEFFIMDDSDYYLTKRYGSNYMTPPSEGQKEKHVYVEFDLSK